MRAGVRRSDAQQAPSKTDIMHGLFSRRLQRPSAKAKAALGAPLAHQQPEGGSDAQRVAGRDGPSGGAGGSVGQ
eukprot:1373115-Alexandrium_andersonii.AAC.1